MDNKIYQRIKNLSDSLYGQFIMKLSDKVANKLYNLGD